MGKKARLGAQEVIKSHFAEDWQHLAIFDISFFFRQKKAIKQARNGLGWYFLEQLGNSTHVNNFGNSQVRSNWQCNTSLTLARVSPSEIKVILFVLDPQTIGHLSLGTELEFPSPTSIENPPELCDLLESRLLARAELQRGIGLQTGAEVAAFLRIENVQSGFLVWM